MSIKLIVIVFYCVTEIELISEIEKEAERKVGWLLKLIFAGTATFLGYQIFPYMGKKLSLSCLLFSLTMKRFWFSNLSWCYLELNLFLQGITCCSNLCRSCESRIHCSRGWERLDWLAFQLMVLLPTSSHFILLNWLLLLKLFWLLNLSHTFIRHWNFSWGQRYDACSFCRRSC